MRLVLIVLVLSSVNLTAEAVKKKASPKKVTAAANRKRTSGANRGRIPHRPSYQTAPSSDRYREIQDALAAKGYLKTPANGMWDQDSQEAMRRFQADQNLDATGKLTARSLISLGLVSKPQP